MISWKVNYLQKKVDLLYQAALELYVAGVESGHCGRDARDEEAVKGARRNVYEHLQSKTKNQVHIPLYVE